MIDFRYHLVSLVSVFLAMALGIVLGAGPLKGSIGTTLTKRVDDLRQDRDALKTELGQAQAAVRHRDDFVTQVSPLLVAGRLTGRFVLVVSLPGVDDEIVTQTRESLDAAGGTVSGWVEVTGDWTAEDRQAFRTQLSTQLADSLDARSVPVAGQDGALATLFARALVTDDLGETGRFDATADTLLEGLRSADLVEVHGDLEGRATEAIVLAPPVALTGTGTPVPSSSARTADVDGWRTLCGALDAASDGTVVLGPGSSAGQGGLLTEIREDARLSREVSTVDTAGSPMGGVAAVLALSEQLSGAAGAYGFGKGTTSPLPLPAGMRADRS